MCRDVCAVLDAKKEAVAMACDFVCLIFTLFPAIENKI